jgi:diguanylate cyclase (GGDEF)-like protein
MSVLADHLALSLQDRNLRRQMQAVNERLQGRAEMLQRILELSNELKTHLTLEHLVQSIVHAVHYSLGYRIVVLSLYEPAENVFERRAQIGFDDALPGAPPRRVLRDEVARWFGERYRISKSYFVSHVDRQDTGEDTGSVDRRRRGAAPGAWHASDLLFVPLTAGDQLIGVLQVDQPRSGLVPRLEDVQALEIFANQAVTAIQSARAYETTRQMSVRDSLTEAFNHRYFQETLSRELARHERSGQTLALVMLDIDDFKRINDRWGHPVGDVVLRGLVEELTKGVREMDTVARYGGEEFALIFPETTPAKAWVVADRLRKRVASRLFVAPQVEQALAITISLGLATYAEDGSTKRLLIERADQALYQAKRSGKNCLVTAASLADLKTL